jgi:hypothetical protein
MHAVFARAAFACWWLATATVGADTPDTSGAAFSVAAKIEGDKVVLSYTLENKGRAPLFANTRLALDAEGCAPERSEVIVTLTDVRDRRLPFRCMFKRSAILPKHYGRLAPGQKARGQFALSDCYEFVPGEKIQVRAQYRDPNPEPPAPPAGVTPLRDPVRAPPIEFTAPVAK